MEEVDALGGKEMIELASKLPKSAREVAFRCAQRKGASVSMLAKAREEVETLEEKGEEWKWPDRVMAASKVWDGVVMEPPNLTLHHVTAEEARGLELNDRLRSGDWEGRDGRSGEGGGGAGGGGSGVSHARTAAAAKSLLFESKVARAKQRLQRAARLQVPLLRAPPGIGEVDLEKEAVKVSQLPSSRYLTPRDHILHSRKREQLAALLDVMDYHGVDRRGIRLSPEEMEERQAAIAQGLALPPRLPYHTHKDYTVSPRLFDHGKKHEEEEGGEGGGGGEVVEERKEERVEGEGTRRQGRRRREVELKTDRSRVPLSMFPMSSLGELWRHHESSGGVARVALQRGVLGRSASVVLEKDPRREPWLRKRTKPSGRSRLAAEIKAADARRKIMRSGTLPLQKVQDAAQQVRQLADELGLSPRVPANLRPTSTPFHTPYSSKDDDDDDDGETDRKLSHTTSYSKPTPPPKHPSVPKLSFEWLHGPVKKRKGTADAKREYDVWLAKEHQRKPNLTPPSTSPPPPPPSPSPLNASPSSSVERFSAIAARLGVKEEEEQGRGGDEGGEGEVVVTFSDHVPSPSPWSQKLLTPSALVSDSSASLRRSAATPSRGPHVVGLEGLPEKERRMLDAAVFSTASLPEGEGEDGDGGGWGSSGGFCDLLEKRFGVKEHSKGAESIDIAFVDLSESFEDWNDEAVAKFAAKVSAPVQQGGLGLTFGMKAAVEERAGALGMATTSATQRQNLGNALRRLCLSIDEDSIPFHPHPPPTPPSHPPSHFIPSPLSKGRGRKVVGFGRRRTVKKGGGRLGDGNMSMIELAQKELEKERREQVSRLRDEKKRGVEEKGIPLHNLGKSARRLVVQVVQKAGDMSSGSLPMSSSSHASIGGVSSRSWAGGRDGKGGDEGEEEETMELYAAGKSKEDVEEKARLDRERAGLVRREATPDPYLPLTSRQPAAAPASLPTLQEVRDEVKRRAKREAWAKAKEDRRKQQARALFDFGIVEEEDEEGEEEGEREGRGGGKGGRRKGERGSRGDGDEDGGDDDDVAAAAVAVSAKEIGSWGASGIVRRKVARLREAGKRSLGVLSEGGKDKVTRRRDFGVGDEFEVARVAGDEVLQKQLDALSRDRAETMEVRHRVLTRSLDRMAEGDTLEDELRMFRVEAELERAQGIAKRVGTGRQWFGKLLECIARERPVGEFTEEEAAILSPMRATAELGQAPSPSLLSSILSATPAADFALPSTQLLLAFLRRAARVSLRHFITLYSQRQDVSTPPAELCLQALFEVQCAEEEKAQLQTIKEEVEGSKDEGEGGEGEVEEGGEDGGRKERNAVGLMATVAVAFSPLRRRDVRKSATGEVDDASRSAREAEDRIQEVLVPTQSTSAVQLQGTLKEMEKEAEVMLQTGKIVPSVFRPPSPALDKKDPEERTQALIAQLADRLEEVRAQGTSLFAPKKKPKAPSPSPSSKPPSKSPPSAIDTSVEGDVQALPTPTLAPHSPAGSPSYAIHEQDLLQPAVTELEAEKALHALLRKPKRRKSRKRHKARKLYKEKTSM